MEVVVDAVLAVAGATGQSERPGGSLHADCRNAELEYCFLGALVGGLAEAGYTDQERRIAGRSER